VLLPLVHFGFAALSLAWGRVTRELILLSLVFDAVLVGLLSAGLSQGKPLVIVLGGWEKGIGIELAADRFSLGLTILALALVFVMLLVERYHTTDSQRIEHEIEGERIP